MAFESFRTQQNARPWRRRRITYTVSVALHGALLVAGVAYSYWHVEELSPPTLHVTLVSSTAPPPPAAPAAAGGGPRKKLPTKPRPTTVASRPNDIVQPRQPDKPPPKESRDEDETPDEPGGVVGGTRGGVIGGSPGGTIGGTHGGTPGGTVGATGTAKSIAPNLGALQKIAGDDPAFPVQLRKSGEVYAVIVKICVSRTGTVDSVTIMAKPDPLLVASVVSAVKGSWRFRPLLADGLPIPFCYSATFQFKGQ